jgi:hypothetical protein
MVNKIRQLERLQPNFPSGV